MTFCCLQWDEDNLLFLGHDLQYLSSYTKKYFLQHQFCHPLFFLSFNFLTFITMLCLDVFIQSDGVSFAVSLLIYHAVLQRHNFAMQVHSDYHSSLYLHSALALENIELNLNKEVLELWSPFPPLLQSKESSSIFVDGVMLSYMIQKYKWCFRVRKEPIRQEWLSKTVLEQVGGWKERKRIKKKTKPRNF